ncbi:cystathionine gamma-synthase [Jatrophihabitans endophyticus]|uniref:Cystathionine gamma-synthase n=1 Tax=Jatrophihabitans endophyticus TaxID=1206085 RepID=A0A1M5RAC6_9ACTN|nr:PLP-dependent transferase [Jatrophihabitans endophyticus]SHH22773.1 cystathionine gamma-synthase [Jatrophihabitans endophyticus]
MSEHLRPASVAVSAGRPHEPGAPLNTPIAPASAFRHDGTDNPYARHHVSPTVASFESVVGELEGGRALAFGSGIAALACLLDRSPAGTPVVVPREGYGGYVGLYAEQHALGRLAVRHVDVTDHDAVRAAARGAALVWVEAVSNPLLTVADLPAVAAIAHEAGALLGVDATFSTPLAVRPLDLGADVVMHSATKYLAGHSDALIGVLVTRSADLHAALHDRRTLAGSTPGVLESYLATRGVRTLAVRMERAWSNAAVLAGRLAEHPAVAAVRYPGLPGDPGHAVAARDHDAFGAVIGIEVAGGATAAEAVCARVRLITHATSLGGVESMIERRARHPGDASYGVPEALLRLSVGIEDVEDLWDDLSQALG